jgi:hypothetical protein
VCLWRSATGGPVVKPSASAAEACRWGLLLLVVLLLFAPAIRRAVFGPGAPGDFQDWGEIAERLLATGRIETPHFIFPLLLAGLGSLLRWLPGITWNWTTAGIALALAFMSLEAVLLTRAFRARLGGRLTTASFAIAASAALALMLVTPITVYSWQRHDLYWGYIGINVYHSPTMFLLKPLALWTWLRLADLVEGRPHGWREVTGLALGVALSTLAKPSYTIALLPGLAGFAAWERRRELLPALAVGVALPATAILLWQFRFTYSAEASGIQWAPFRVMGGSPLGVAGRLAFSVAFPAAFAVLYWKQARGRATLRLAWLVFAAGAALSYLVAEKGPRAAHGNFLWSGQAALFLLFVASALVLLEEARRQPKLNARLAVCLTVFGLHLVSGVLFLLHPLWW